MVQQPDSSQIVFDAEDEYRPEPPPPPELPAWQDGSVRVGIHTSIADDITESLEIAHRLGANALQIFSGSPRMWPRAEAQGFGSRILEADAARFRARRAELKLGPLVIHDNYLINLASPERVLRARSIQAFRDEVIRAMSLSADFLVAHPGASRGAERFRAVQEMAQALRQSVRGLRLGGLRILLENTAGQGTMMGARLEELRAILDACPDLQLGVCLDTAHLFAAGYPIHTAEGLERTLQAIEHTVGLRRVHVLHANDSKAAFGSRVDRHQHVGKGKIGREAFRRILNHPLLAGRAFILETPIDKPGDDARNVRTLWQLLGVRMRLAAGARDSFAARAKRRSRAKAKRAARKRQRPERRSARRRKRK